MRNIWCTEYIAVCAQVMNKSAKKVRTGSLFCKLESLVKEVLKQAVICLTATGNRGDYSSS